MGGGCILYTKAVSKNQGTDNVSPKPLEVLEGMCDCIFASKEYGDAHMLKTICSIVLQRVSCMTSLQQSDHRHIHEYISALADAFSVEDT